VEQPNSKRSTPGQAACGLLPSATNADNKSLAARVQARKEARRKITVIISSPQRRDGDADALIPTPPRGTPNKAWTLIDAARKGMEKMTPICRDHIRQMLLANDVAGLRAAAEGSQPLRSYVTAFKVGKQLLERNEAKQLPEDVRKALAQMKSLYEANPAFVRLGDTSAFNHTRPYSREDIKALMAVFDHVDPILDQLQLGLLHHGSPALSALAFLGWMKEADANVSSS
jgi:hypothetical protein